MPILRCQVILKHKSGLPRDNVTNTFWVDPNAATVDATYAEQVAEKVRNFYTEDVAGIPQPPWVYLGRQIVNTGHEVKVAPVNAATGLDSRGIGFPPLWDETFDFIGRNVPTDPVPSEVAACLSFKNTSFGAVAPARRRGRIYFGPLNRIVFGDVDQVARVTSDLADSLLGAGLKLKTQLDGLGATWVVYSRPFEGRAETPRPGNPRGPLPALAARAGTVYPVQSLWVDDAFDTVRKRGERPTSRRSA